MRGMAAVAGGEAVGVEEALVVGDEEALRNGEADLEGARGGAHDAELGEDGDKDEEAGPQDEDPKHAESELAARTLQSRARCLQPRYNKHLTGSRHSLTG